MACAPDNAGRAIDRLPSLQAHAEFGCRDCKGADLFSSIVAVTAASGGTVVALDAAPPHIRVLGDERSTAFAGEGEGPGELKRPSGVSLRPGNEIVVSDMGTDRVSAFDLDGDYRGTLSSPGSAPISIVSSPAGRWTLLVQLEPIARSNSYLVLDTAFTPVGTIRAPPWLYEGAVRSTAGLLTAYAIADDGRIALGYGGDRYRIVTLDAGGLPLRMVERDVPRRARTERELSELRERMASPPVFGSRDSWPEARISRFDPHFNMTALRFDPEGRLWVRTERAGPKATIFDVFGSGLEHLGEVRLDERIGVYHMAGDLLVAETRDTLGVPAVRSWRIR